MDQRAQPITTSRTESAASPSFEQLAAQQACASGVKREPVPPTRVVSMLFKGDTRALAYRPPITGRLLGISIMTLAELERWSLERNWGQGRKLELAQHLTRYTVLPVSRT